MHVRVRVNDDDKERILVEFSAYLSRLFAIISHSVLLKQFVFFVPYHAYRFALIPLMSMNVLNFLSLHVV